MKFLKSGLVSLAFSAFLGVFSAHAVKIGVDLGGTGIKAALVDENNKIVAQITVQTPAKGCTLDALSEAISIAIKSIIENAKIDLNSIKSIGLGVPGPVDDKNNTVSLTNIGLKNVNLTAAVSEKLGYTGSLKMANDAYCAAYGVYVQKPGRGTNILFTLGTGLGYCVIRNGEIIPSEGGHSVIDINSSRGCGCGRFGCAETYVSAPGLIKTAYEVLIKYNESDIFGLSNRHKAPINIFEECQKSNHIAKEIIDKYTQHLLCVAINAHNTFLKFGDPVTIYFGGGISGQGEVLLKLLNEGLKNPAPYNKTHMGKINIKIAPQGNEAGLIGAASL